MSSSGDFRPGVDDTSGEERTGATSGTGGTDAAGTPIGGSGGSGAATGGANADAGSATGGAVIGVGTGIGAGAAIGGAIALVGAGAPGTPTGTKSARSSVTGISQAGFFSSTMIFVPPLHDVAYATTRRTSSIEVSPMPTFAQPSWRSVSIPSAIATRPISALEA